MRALVFLLALSLPVSVGAGYRELEVLVVRVDTNKDKASRSCWRTIYGAFRDDGANLRTQNRKRLADASKYADFVGFGAWPDSKLADMRDANDRLDAVVLVSCDAEARLIEAVAVSGTDPTQPTISRLRLSGEPVDRKNAKLMGDLIVRTSYAGFEL